MFRSEMLIQVCTKSYKKQHAIVVEFRRKKFRKQNDQFSSPSYFLSLKLPMTHRVQVCSNTHTYNTQSGVTAVGKQAVAGSNLAVDQIFHLFSDNR